VTQGLFPHYTEEKTEAQRGLRHTAEEGAGGVTQQDSLAPLSSSIPLFPPLSPVSHQLVFPSPKT
jgi:hypothetical protein